MARSHTPSTEITSAATPIITSDAKESKTVRPALSPALRAEIAARQTPTIVIAHKNKQRDSIIESIRALEKRAHQLQQELATAAALRKSKYNELQVVKGAVAGVAPRPEAKAQPVTVKALTLTPTVAEDRSTFLGKLFYGALYVGTASFVDRRSIYNTNTTNEELAGLRKKEKALAKQCQDLAIQLKTQAMFKNHFQSTIGTLHTKLEEKEKDLQSPMAKAYKLMTAATSTTTATVTTPVETTTTPVVTATTETAVEPTVTPASPNASVASVSLLASSSAPVDAPVLETPRVSL